MEKAFLSHVKFLNGGYLADLGEGSPIAAWRTREDSHNEAYFVPRIPA
jgi:hypothetical protein